MGIPLVIMFLLIARRALTDSTKEHREELPLESPGDGLSYAQVFREIARTPKLKGRVSPAFQALATDGKWLSEAAEAVFKHIGPVTEKDIKNGAMDDFHRRLLDRIMFDVWYASTATAWNTAGKGRSRTSAITALGYDATPWPKLTKNKLQAILRTWLLNIALPKTQEPKDAPKFERWYWEQ